MWKDRNNSDEKLLGFYTPPPKRSSISSKSWMSEQTKKNSDIFHVIHKVPSGHSPYVKAKHVQLIEKDPSRAVAMFWNAINAGDRVDSALKDMAVVMKQLDRSDEAIEAIKSFRHLCSSDSQESLDNVLVELYKRSGRLEEQIEVLQQKLKRVEEGFRFVGRRVKVGKSQGKKVQITVEQEYARLLGNLAWAYLQQNDYETAEEYYRKALSIEPDRNKQCNLAICLMCMNRIAEAKFLLQVTRASAPEGLMDESYAKSFERASDLLAEIENQPDESSCEAEKENCYGNARFFAFSPHKKPYESVRNSNRRGSDNELDLKDGARSRDSFATSNIGSSVYNTAAFDASFNCKRAYTPSVPARGIPKSPFTQPRKSLSHDSRNWRKGTYSNEPVSCLPRRLQFENPADSGFQSTKDLRSEYSETDEKGTENTINMPIDSTPNRKVSDMTADVDRKEHLSVTKTYGPENEGRDSYSCLWDFSSFKSQKSWADMADEEEQEMLQMHQYSVDTQQDSLKTKNRLEVFRDLTPE
uniref:Uncharacterized protein n=2 Tax=Chenopodium quinoa TaxID=63459 RepID=A0A803KUJ1_CHEQI